MAAGRYKFALDKDLPLKDLIKGIEPMMPVGARSFQLVQTDGTTNAEGEPNHTVTDLSYIQGRDRPHPDSLETSIPASNATLLTQPH